MLAGVRGQMCVFQEAVITSSSLRGAVAQGRVRRREPRQHRSLSGAELDICCFYEGSAARCLLGETRLHKTGLLRSKMPKASFYRASGEGCSWQGAMLDGADFRVRQAPGRPVQQGIRGGHLHAADFAEAAERASLVEAFSRART